MFSPRPVVPSSWMPAISDVKRTQRVQCMQRVMNANWSGLFEDYPLVGTAVESVMGRMKRSGDLTDANLKYSAFAGGPGIFGMRNEIHDCWLIFCSADKYKFPNPDDINGGTHHFGSPFNFPEEFITVYRLHPLVPDLIEYRKFNEPDHIQATIPVVETFRNKATTAMHEKHYECRWSFLFFGFSNEKVPIANESRLVQWRKLQG